MVRKSVLSVLLVFALSLFSASAQEELATEVRFGHFAADAANVDVFSTANWFLRITNPRG